MTAKTKRRKNEGTRGPRKGQGGRPRRVMNGQRRSVRLESREWRKLFRYSNGTSYTSRVRDLVELANKSTKKERAKLATKWKEIIATDRRGTMVEPTDQSILLDAETWDTLAELLPLGSWADKLRQAMELAKIQTTKAKEKAKTK
ncbi:hypothetical protein LCGC14_0273860 [marine sediment metagenome]|uniref:Uncharacterized protein n=2 Tax=root TaxID=1 RepID=A0A9C9NIL6_9HYPH|nr:hypothetical protein [Aurantimonas coralicida]